MEMSRGEIAEKLGEVMKMAMSGSFDPSSLTENSTLTGDVGLSSVGVLYIVIGIEELFNIRFDDVGFGDFVTVGDVIDYIEKKVNQ